MIAPGSPILGRAGCLCAAAWLTACNVPRTDISVTMADGVGPYHVGFTEEGETLRGHVCLATGGDAEEIVARVMEQRKNHHHRRIALDVYATTHAIGGFVWSRSGLQQEPLTASHSPCMTGGDPLPQALPVDTHLREMKARPR